MGHSGADLGGDNPIEKALERRRLDPVQPGHRLAQHCITGEPGLPGPESSGRRELHLDAATIVCRSSFGQACRLELVDQTHCTGVGQTQHIGEAAHVGAREELVEGEQRGGSATGQARRRLERSGPVVVQAQNDRSENVEKSTPGVLRHDRRL